MRPLPHPDRTAARPPKTQRAWLILPGRGYAVCNRGSDSSSAPMFVQFPTVCDNFAQARAEHNSLMASLAQLSPADGLPSSVHTEVAILGAMLLDSVAISDATEKLKAEDFS